MRAPLHHCHVQQVLNESMSSLELMVEVLMKRDGGTKEIFELARHVFLWIFLFSQKC